MLKRTFVLPLLIAASMGCTPAINRDEAVANAEAALKSGQLNEARIDLQNVLVENPNDVEARLLLAQVLLANGNYAGAEKEYRKAQQLGNNSPEVKLGIARAQVRLGEFEEVINTDFDASNLSDDQIAQMYVYKGVAASAVGKKEEAILFFEQASQVGQDSTYSQLGNVYVTNNSKSLDEAISLLNELLDENPEVAEAHLLLGQLNLKANDYQSAISAFRKYSEMQPESREAKVLLAGALVQAREYDEGKQLTSKLLKEFPGHPYVNQLGAIIAFNEQDYKTAKRMIDIAVTAGLRTEVAMVIKGISDYQLENYEQSYQSLKTVVNKLPGDHPARRLYVLTQILLGYDQEASATVKRWDNLTSEDASVVAMLGTNLARSGKEDKAREILQELESIDLENAEDIARVGLLKIQLNDMSGAADLENAIAKNENLQGAKLGLIDAYLKSGNVDSLMKFGQELIKSESSKLLGYNTIALAYREKNEFEKATDAYLEAQKIDELNPPSRIFFANLALVEGNREEAIAQLEPLVEGKPEFIEGVKMLVALYSRDALDKGIAKLEKVVDKVPNNTELRVLLARLYLRQGKFDEVHRTLQLDDDMLRSASDDYYHTRLESYLQEENFNDAEDLLAKWVRLQPQSEIAAVTQISYFKNIGKNNKLMQAIERAISDIPQSQSLKAIQIKQLLDKNDTRRAKQALNKTSDKFSSSVVGQGLKGHILLAENKPEDALPLLEAYYEEAPNLFNVKAIALALKATNQPEKVQEFLSNRVESHPDDVYSRNLLANLVIYNNPALAKEQYREILKQQPNNIIAANNLAWLLMNEEKYEEAKKIATDAIALQENVPSLLDTLGQIELKMGNKNAAVDLFAKAYSITPTSSIALHYAQALLASGDREQSRQIVSQIESVNSKKMQDELEALRSELK
ncbi:XrtA/PEP-CTERM system TPR-repeat protein PrsT [Alteromonas sp. ASW11-130]|uniref:XrtA/PEP-CTERM system TPR-repeat protein PrsT n=1 Tax=Alteromonas sp. ASW11-130 TaxID=3015775 RepID=UPI00224198D5|nr:XrtA/PEP-CTERM system TPR-repeat protein PrsT [Alteromonas sp. ASW11-130]MCW8091269.1 PEP-CTERM system TPR-repeat protein PrsT [Alteromonas sp. ASW11-130]